MKKIIPVISVIVVLVVLLTIPAAAASSGWYKTSCEFSTEAYWCDRHYELWYNDLFTGTENGGSFAWTLERETYLLEQRLYFVLPISGLISVSAGDTVSIPFISTYTGWFGGTGNLMQVRLSVVACDVNGKPLRRDELAAGQEYGPLFEIVDPSQLIDASSIVKYGGQEWTYTPPDLDYKIFADCSTARVCLVFDMVIRTDAEFIVSVNQKQFEVGYGNPNSPEVPSYTPPSDEDKFSDLDGAEQELAVQNQDGLDAAGAIIGDFTLQQFASGLTALVSIYNVLLPRLGWLNALISVSLALGIVSFLLNIAHSLVGKFSGSGNRSARRKKGG